MEKNQIIVDNKNRKPGNPKDFKELLDYKVDLFNGWQIVFCIVNFCKICHKPIFMQKGIRSSSKRHYYHLDCAKMSAAYREAMSQIFASFENKNS